MSLEVIIAVSLPIVLFGTALVIKIKEKK